MKIIRCSAADLKIVKENMQSGKKIAAIKHLRNTGTTVGEEGQRPGLRDAKIAVEGLDGTKPHSHYDEVRIAPELRILSFIVEADEGVIEVDLDGLQLKLLDGLSHLPLTTMASMTELITFIRRWQGDIGRVLDDE